MSTIRNFEGIGLTVSLTNWSGSKNCYRKKIMQILLSSAISKFIIAIPKRCHDDMSYFCEVVSGHVFFSSHENVSFIRIIQCT